MENSPETETVIKSPELETSIEDLNTQYTEIAETYNLPKTVIVHFIVDVNGDIRELSFVNVNNSEAHLKITDLIQSIDTKPGSVSGRPVSMGMGLTLVSS